MFLDKLGLVSCLYIASYCRVHTIKLNNINVKIGAKTHKSHFVCQRIRLFFEYLGFITLGNLQSATNKLLKGNAKFDCSLYCSSMCCFSPKSSKPQDFSDDLGIWMKVGVFSWMDCWRDCLILQLGMCLFILTGYEVTGGMTTLLSDKVHLHL